jgi:EF hand
MNLNAHNLISATALALLATGAAWAQSTAPAMGSTAQSDKPAMATPDSKPMSAKDLSLAFTKADINKDGKLDRLEAESVSGLAAKFDQADADGDKLVSRAEFEKTMRQ